MLPLERFFNDQMDDALRMLNADDSYWSGFAFGLLGFYGGDRVPVTRWHESLLSPDNDTLLARGYREGVRAMTEAAGGRVPYRFDASAGELTVPVSTGAVVEKKTPRDPRGTPGRSTDSRLI